MIIAGKNEEVKKWSHVNKTIRKEYKKLGSFRFPEVVLLVMVILLIFLWLLRELEGIDGWSEVRVIVYPSKSVVVALNSIYLTCTEKCSGIFPLILQLTFMLL
jgi:di/tricarboxylate transporter